MAREIREHSHSFNLELFVLRGENVALQRVEHTYSELISKQLVMRHVIEHDVGATAYCIKKELFALLDILSSD